MGPWRCRLPVNWASLRRCCGLLKLQGVGLRGCDARLVRDFLCGCLVIWAERIWTGCGLRHGTKRFRPKPPPHI